MMSMLRIGGFLLLFTLSLSLEPKVINPKTCREISVNGLTFQRCLDAGYIYHDNALHKIRPGGYPEPILSKTWERIKPSRIYALDEMSEILFVHKPSGLLTVPGREQPDCLISRVQEEYPQAKVCHRLDRDTSGVLAIALNANIHREFSKQFQTRQAAKTYTALAAGHIREEQGVIDLPIGKAMTDEGYNRWVIGGTDPREAQTEWKAKSHLQLENGFCYTRVHVSPLTGRGQQIRLHMKAIGNPLLGDTLHAPDDIAKATPRLCLHATKLGLRVYEMPVEAWMPSPF